MALPKLETPTYTLILPSTGEEIKYRPFLVKEQKQLMMAEESKNQDDMINTMSALIRDCTFGAVNPDTCPIFDAEYIFLRVRGKSVGDKVDINLKALKRMDKKVDINKRDIMNSLPTQIRKVIGHIEFSQPLDNSHGRG